MKELMNLLLAETQVRWYLARSMVVDAGEWLAWKAAWLLPRRLVYAAAVRLFAHASFVLHDTEMNAITPSDALKAWGVREDRE